MAEEEFWASSYAKVYVLAKRVKALDKRRDYFTASIVALMSSKPISPSDVLSAYYRPDNVTVTSRDPDVDGAAY